MENNILIGALLLTLVFTVFCWARMRFRYKETLEAYNNLSLSHDVLKRSVKNIPLTFMPDPEDTSPPPTYRVFKVFRPPTAPPTDLYCPQEFIVMAADADAAVLLCMNHYELDEWWISEPVTDSPQVITIVEKL